MSYYNIGAKYEIIGRISKGTSVIAYMLRDRTNKQEFPMEKGMVEQLALTKQIYNSTAQVYNDLVNLKGINCKLSKLPKYKEDGTPYDVLPEKKVKLDPDLIIIGKMTEGRMITDYIVTYVSTPDIKMRVPKETVIQLALDGRFTNAKVQKNGNATILRGIEGTNLNKLDTYIVR